MVKISGNDVLREGTKIGWLSGNDVYNLSGTKVGFYTANDIYNDRGVKIAYLDGAYLRLTNGTNLATERVRREIQGGAYSDLARAAILLLLGN